MLCERPAHQLRGATLQYRVKLRKDLTHTTGVPSRFQRAIDPELRPLPEMLDTGLIVL
jgi:hypothetical protein